MDEVREAAETFLAKHPDAEESLRRILEIDEASDPWTFDDVPMDSGRFGEAVSLGVVARDDEGYRLTDRDAVRGALDGDDGTIDPSDSLDRFSVSFPRIDRRVATSLAAALAAVVMFRLLSFPAVFRDGDVVLSGNDPYYYRYWIERLISESSGTIDFSTVSGLPEAVANGEPLMVVTLWGLSSLLGGDAYTVGAVLAWYPVFSAIITGVLVYILATKITRDRRIGFSAVALLAITPVHAFRTSLGFADHHAFDYPWLVLCAIGLTMMVMEEDADRFPVNQRTGVAIAVLGFGVVGQTLAWDAGALLIVPIGLYTMFRVLSDVRSEVSPLRATLPIAAAVAFGALLTGIVHGTLGWHTTIVAGAPLLLAVGVVGAILAAEVVFRLRPSARVLAGVDAVGIIGGILALTLVLPDYSARLQSQLTTLFAPQDVVETGPLFGATTFGWLLLFGFLLILALPYIIWAGWRAFINNRPALLVGAVYGSYFLLLSAIQLRFAGELAPFVAVFAGFGLVHLGEQVGIARPPVPFRKDPTGLSGTFLSLPARKDVLTFAALFLLVAGLGIVQVPVKINQVTVPGDEYAAMTSMREYASDRGWDYPENYVFSQWDNNRMYNYFVNGQSRSYFYAEEHYGAFLASTDPGGWFTRLDGRVGFIVTEDADSNDDTMHARMHRRYGSRGIGHPGLARYRTIFVGDDGSPAVATIVPGATINGTGPANSTVTVTTNVTVPGASFRYTRAVDTGPAGKYSITVSYPGEYSAANTSVTVPASAVENGRTIRTGDPVQGADA